MARYDKGGEEFYNILSAYHKSLRGSDPQAALYWMARMIEAGQDPMVMFRRAIAMAAEDIGMADPNALIVAVNARTAFHTLGPPEGYLPLAEMTIYLATAPKSNAVYVAYGAFERSTGLNSINLVKSTDCGRKWTQPVAVADVCRAAGLKVVEVDA